jgi:hypothetical protein
MRGRRLRNRALDLQLVGDLLAPLGSRDAPRPRSTLSLVSRSVSLFTYVAGNEHFIGSMTVNGTGNGSMVIKPIHTATYSAGPPATEHTSPSGSTRKRVGVHIHVDPNSTGWPVVVRLEKKSSGHWSLVAQVAFDLRTGSTVAPLVNGKELKQDVLCRKRGSFKNGLNLLGVSPWSEFKIP